MAQPTLTRTGQRVYDSLEPVTRDVDEANGWAAANYSGALAAMFDPVADVVSDAVDGTPGYAVLFNADTVTAAYLEWLGQFRGVSWPSTYTTAQKRTAIKERPAAHRGTPQAIKSAAKTNLTGTKDVSLFPRVNADGTDNPYGYIVVTYTAETPDPAATLNDVEAQKPAGFLLTYRTDPGWSIGQMETFYASGTLATLEGAGFADLDALEHHLP
jgi:hypothetical protein